MSIPPPPHLASNLPSPPHPFYLSLVIFFGCSWRAASNEPLFPSKVQRCFTVLYERLVRFCVIASFVVSPPSRLHSALSSIPLIFSALSWIPFSSATHIGNRQSRSSGTQAIVWTFVLVRVRVSTQSCALTSALRATDPTALWGPVPARDRPPGNSCCPQAARPRALRPCRCRPAGPSPASRPGGGRRRWRWRWRCCWLGCAGVQYSDSGHGRAS